MIWRKLSDRHLVIPLSFEGVGDTAFEKESHFVKMFIRQVSRYLTRVVKDPSLSGLWQEETFR